MSKLRVIIVDDSEDDACLILWELRREGDKIESERVETAIELGAALDKGHWDAVISDYRMPQFSGLSALAQVRSNNTRIPFLVVCATVEPKVAAEALRLGANECIMKDQLRQLLPALRRALEVREG
jgi:two-component system, cell cycle sensor histidine kinase and response regulator CckA